MAAAYDLRAINNLLGDAFNSGGIDTLAFDLFQPVYRDFGPGMNRAQKIEAVVLYAEQNGRIPDLLAYVQQKNPYQYNRYAAQFQSAPQSESHTSPGTPATTNVTTEQFATTPQASTSARSVASQESPATVPQPAATPASNAQRPASENDSRLLMSAVIAVLAIMVVSAAVLRYILNVTEVSNLILLLLIELPFVLVIIGKLTGQDFLNWLSKLSKRE